MQSQASKIVASGRLISRLLRYKAQTRRSHSEFLAFSVGAQSARRRTFLTTHKKRNFHTNPCTEQKSTKVVLSPHALSAVSVPHDDDELEDEVERFTAECMSQLLPRYRHYLDEAREPSSLDLELGEESVWDTSLEDDNDEIVEEYIDEEEEHVASKTAPRQSPRAHRSTMELLMNFDPQNPPSSNNLEDLQLWLECEAQQESVLKYQSVIENARDRKDYSSLSMVQRQILQWFQPLKDEIASRQKEYMMKEGNSPKTAKRYGPSLCTLPPEKLAVITAHESIMTTLLRSGANGREGVPFVTMVERIGGAVEEEVLIHRMLYKRFKDAQLRFQDDNEGLEGNATKAEQIDKSETSILPEHATEVDGKESDESAATHKWAYAASHLKNYMEEINQQAPSAKKRRVVSYAIRRARQILEKDEDWTSEEKIQLGAALFQILLEKATVSVDGKEEMAFTYEKRWLKRHKIKSFVTLNDKIYKMVVSDDLKSFSASTTRYKPMIIPPKPWTKADAGGYMWLKADLMRYHGCNTQKEALQNADLSTVFDGLNALGRVPWKINKEVLNVAQKCWESDIPLGDVPSRTDFDVPPEPIPPPRPTTKLDKESPAYKEYAADQRTYREALAKHRRIKQKNMDLRSLRCSAILKLDQAAKFKDFEEIFFPYNMDFRGRAYPVPPHLSNVGSDLCRGMLKFAEAKPLGQHGLYWLKVHLANFAGKDKMTFDDRAKFVDDNMEKVRESAEDPFAGDRWWMDLEDPFQGLATCIEIVNAVDSGDPASYMCSLPVHMDGSCNGLQHYAALGRDRVGGKAVNLCDYDEPQDVYVGVMHEVIRRVAEEAEKELDFDDSDVDSLSRKQKKALTENRAAKLMNGLIDRGVVKRTVMTSVYGVTYIGAREQIQEKIIQKLEGKGYDIDEMDREIFQASGYLARVTMDVMGDLFQGARGTMNWLTTCARMISQHGYPVAWISPIGIPALQPYRQKKVATLVTLMQTVTLATESDDLPIHKQRQVSAFPPNYVHSLDSSHMLLTALEMDRRGLAFSAVHDSFWTHACDIDEMNEALRDVFVELYDQPLLERLKRTWEMRYPDLTFPDLPKRGELDLNEVKRAKYFFQ